MINISEIVRPNINKLQAYSSARDEYSGLKGTFLDANENPFGSLNRYPDPQQKLLKQRLSELKRVNSQNIFIGNGSDEVIDLALRIFCNPGIDKALTFSPTYGMYRVSAAINNIELLEIPLLEDFQIDMDKVKPFLNQSRIKLIFICSPNNPTGNLMKEEDIRYILKNFNGVVMLDEAYIDFASKGSLINLFNEYNNLIVCQTFSKAWGLAAARVGTAYSSEEIIRYYNKVKPPYNISQLNQQAAIGAIEKYAEFKTRLSLIKKEKFKMIKALEGCEVVKKIYPSEANFLLIKVSNADKLYMNLITQNIITRNRSKQIENCLRVSLGTPKENELFVNAMKIAK